MAMHDDRLANEGQTRKAKTTAAVIKEDGRTKTTAKKRLRDAAQVEHVAEPLDEAVLFLNHLLKIGTDNGLVAAFCRSSDERIASQKMPASFLDIIFSTTHCPFQLKLL